MKIMQIYVTVSSVGRSLESAWERNNAQRQNETYQFRGGRNKIYQIAPPTDFNQKRLKVQQNAYN